MKRTHILLMSAVSISVTTFVAAQTSPSQYASPVPRFTFSETLEQQEKELTDNSLLKRFHESRTKLL